MSHADIGSDEPISKKARISPAGIMNPRESFDTDMNFGETNLNDLLPEELGFNASTSYETNGQSMTNGPSSGQAVNGNESYPMTSMQNGPSSIGVSSNSYGGMPGHSSQNNVVDSHGFMQSSQNSQNPGVTVTSAPINGSQQFGGGPGPATPGGYGNAHPPISSSSSQHGSVLCDLLLGGAGPRSVPSGNMHLAPSPQRPPTAPNGPAASFARSPSVNVLSSPPSMMQPGRHPSGGSVGQQMGRNDGFPGSVSVPVSMAQMGYNGTSIPSSGYQHGPPMYRGDGGPMNMMNRMPNGPQASMNWGTWDPGLVR